MRWSQLHVPTLRDDPAEADAVSHRLLVRAGYIRQLMAGHYSLLPAAVRVRAKVMAIIREEMERIGAQEFLLPTVHPAEIWQQSGRWTSMGDEMFRVRDRKGADLALGMTHEEIFANLAPELRSYRQLPQTWYQFQTKFRDEPRPKSGLIRTREFTMKDSYSFDTDTAGLDRSFALHRDAYVRIFQRLGIPAVPVQASSGTMGGKVSVEFMCPSPAGEDLIVHCPTGDYAANVEKATSRLSEAEEGPAPAAPEPFATPDAADAAELALAYGIPLDRQVTTRFEMVDDQVTMVLLRADHTLVPQKLADALGAVGTRPASSEEVAEALGSAGAEPGALGPVGVAGLRVVADEALRGRRDLVTAGSTDVEHLRGVDLARDVSVTHWADLREVVAGDGCPECGRPLMVERTVEVGHIFKLGTTYSEIYGAFVTDTDGRRAPLVMGSYGIGVERAIGAIVECHHDESGIVWPVAVAPFEVAVVIAQHTDPVVTEAAAKLYEQLRAAGVDAVLDDRRDRLGVKLRDVELAGIPYRVTVGARGLAEGLVEVVDRATGEREDIPLDDVHNQLVERVTARR
ncbi:proline--tRNA ligase [Streptomyces sp. BPTC-684]|uniref:proline--tRNA ligase n=1 Tax=Streptomyces sp. BPTC-684 TaxID=3043734 RepID=UPI0024B04868|nr:proline--tRNA ligase [Streptomyces sp. BPTC-684]WHM37872.1 proline--tRNA ligase [Streptomyces sp. BPTC-684]